MSNADDGYWAEREITELRARENHYRERLAKHSVLGEKLRRCSVMLQNLLRGHSGNQGQLLATLREVARQSSQALGVRRASVWLAGSEPNQLHCRALLVDGVEAATEDMNISLTSCPGYLQALTGSDALAVEDAQNDPRTRELAGYLRANRIGALLDSEARGGGQLLGIVCHEHVGERRVWWPDEEAFASHLGSLVALAIEAERRVSAEYAARELEARYRHLVESLPVIVYSFGANMKSLEYVSPRVVELGGWSASEWLAMGAEKSIERIHPDDRRPALQRLERGPAPGSPQELVYRVRLSEQDTRWIRDTCSVVRDELGEPMAVQGVLSDITSQRTAELERCELQRRSDALMEHCALVVVQMDAQARIQEVNPHFVELTGYGSDEVRGLDWLSFAVPAEEGDRLRVSLREAMRTGAVQPRAEYAIRLKSGQQRRLLWTRAVRRDNDGTVCGLLTVGMDLTDRMQLERELMRRTTLESLGRLSAAVSHDFNNLLTVLSGQSDLLAAQASGKQAKLAKAALDAALEQASDLTRSLLVYSRQQPELKQRTDPDALIRESLPLASAMLGERFRLSASLHAEGARIWMDRTRLKQVVFNLVGNAADATEDLGVPDAGGYNVRLATHVEFVEAESAQQASAGASGEFVVLTVSDDGPGMDRATMERIFEPFFTTKGEGRGTGLGLPICQSIVQQAGGFIEVESQPGQGATFRVFLPRDPCA